MTTTLRLVSQSSERIDFALANRVPGGSVQVEGNFRFAPTNSGTTIDWIAAVVARTGIVKIVPESVIAAQVETSLLEIWQGVRENWNRWER